MLGGQGGGCASGHDDINLERNQFGRKSGEPLELPLGISVFDHDVAALDVTEVTQSLTEGLAQVGASGQVGRQVAYSSDLGRLLRLGGERRGEKRPGRDQEVPALDVAPSFLFPRKTAGKSTLDRPRGELAGSAFGWRQHLADTVAEADPHRAVALAPSAQHHRVAVLEEGARLAVRQRARLLAAHASARSGAGLARGSGPDMVPLPNRSPGRRLQPLIVWCATICASVQ